LSPKNLISQTLLYMKPFKGLGASLHLCHWASHKQASKQASSPDLGLWFGGNLHLQVMWNGFATRNHEFLRTSGEELLEC
jgi:hypothetical protein